MLTEVKKADVKALYPVPKPDSHKGQNGRVLIVGGCRDYYGAPILAAMGALFGGNDLVYLMVPECNFDVSRSYYPDFIVRSFPGDYLDMRGIEPIAHMATLARAVLMGPGIGDHPDTLEAVEALVKKIKIPVVLDAQAIHALPRNNLRENPRVLITPHAQEFSDFCGEHFPSLLIEKVEHVKKITARFNVNILVKNPVDIVGSHDGQFCINQAGNAGMTSGGTGDVLAGFVASLASRGVALYDAARIGVFIVCAAGDELLEQKGHAFTATDLALRLPYTIREILR